MIDGIWLTVAEAAKRIPCSSVKAIRRLIARKKWPKLRRMGNGGRSVIHEDSLGKLREALIKAKLGLTDAEIELLREEFARLGLSTDHLPPKK